MAYIRRLPSGRWQATIYTADRTRHTHSALTRREVASWAAEQEAAVARGAFRDPRAGRVTFADWTARWLAARVVSKATSAKNASHLRVHVMPRWGRQPLDSITRLEVRGWVATMQEQGVGPHTIAACVTLFSSIVGAAVDEGILGSNPCSKIATPPTPPKAPRFFSHDEADAILAELPEPYRTFVDAGCHLGLRWGELTGLSGADVSWLRGRLFVRQVLTRYGLRPHPKSAESAREVPIPPHLLASMSQLMTGRAPDALVFTGRNGGPLGESNFRNRVWRPALAAAGVDYASPHTMRHTAASWLVMAGVDLYRVQALLGHESFRTTQRYAHLAPGAHDVVLNAWSRGQQERDAR